MSDELRVRLFLEQVEQVEKLLTSKQQAVNTVTAELEHIKGEIAERSRLKARHAVLAAVATAKAAQQDAEIKQAEEQLWLFEEQAAKGGSTTGDTQQCQETSPQQCPAITEVHTEVHVDDSDSMDGREKTLAEEKLKLAAEEAKVAKAKELLAAMNFEGQLAKLQEKQRALEEREQKAESDHHEACNHLRAVLGDVDTLEFGNMQQQGTTWPDENTLHRPVTTLADALKLLQSLSSDKKVQATWAVVRSCQQHLCRPAAHAQEDTASGTEPPAPQAREGPAEGDQVGESTPEDPSLPANRRAGVSQEPGPQDGPGSLDIEELRAVFATPEALRYGTAQLKQVAGRIAGLQREQAELEAKVAAIEDERQQRCAAIAKMDEETRKHQTTLSDFFDVE